MTVLHDSPPDLDKKKMTQKIKKPVLMTPILSFSTSSSKKYPTGYLLSNSYDHQTSHDCKAHDSPRWEILDAFHVTHTRTPRICEDATFADRLVRRLGRGRLVRLCAAKRALPRYLGTMAVSLA